MALSLLSVVSTALVLLLFLVLRNARRRSVLGVSSASTGFGDATGGSLGRRVMWGRQASPWFDGKEVRDSVKQSFVFWGGAIAGVLSAALTHQLDLLKTLRHVGKEMPETWGGYFNGMFMGSWAQGQRFAVTLVLNATLQRKFDKLEKAAKDMGPRTAMVLSFLLSMVAAGIGEFLSNPPVVVKNYQISEGLSVFEAVEALYNQGGVGRFFRGVGMGVLRKSLANACVLQTIGTVKVTLVRMFPRALGGSDSGSKAALSFIAGSLTGALAEVMTNHPDQVKTMTQAGVPFLEAFAIASRNPFRGALWAGVRKGAIRGINWGCLEINVHYLEKAYRKYRKLSSPPANVEKEEFDVHCSEFNRLMSSH
mmetsp:Transcript_5253/g.14223  ORF Transcript_5253/g.14223 Transcript_5253/m.14223 type:complete len:366 (+) Transcript_5253:75-1172(+)